jgi:hypothetical protein
MQRIFQAVIVFLAVTGLVFALLVALQRVFG